MQPGNVLHLDPQNDANNPAAQEAATTGERRCVPLGFIGFFMRPLGVIMDQELLDAAKLHARAVKIIANALKECSHPSLKPEDHEGNATAILARLAHANILIDKYDPAEETREPQWPANGTIKTR